jgi:hypothetical protein
MIIRKLKRVKQFAQLFLNYKKLKKTTALALENAYLMEVMTQKLPQKKRS